MALKIKHSCGPTHDAEAGQYAMHKCMMHIRTDALLTVHVAQGLKAVPRVFPTVVMQIHVF